MKTMHTNINTSREILLNKEFYKTIYANQLTTNDIGKKVYFIHSDDITCRIIYS
jgi:hypothetical protein